MSNTTIYRMYIYIKITHFYFPQKSHKISILFKIFFKLKKKEKKAYSPVSKIHIWCVICKK